jgi:triphosphoribosyl-dephospho-CoA synthetase
VTQVEGLRDYFALLQLSACLAAAAAGGLAQSGERPRSFWLFALIIALALDLSPNADKKNTNYAIITHMELRLLCANANQMRRLGLAEP